MANETVLTSIKVPTDVVSAGIGAAIIEKVVVVPLINATDMPTNTTVKYMRVDGSLTASTTAVSEASSYTTLTQYSTTGVALTAIKDVVCSFVSVESLKFGGVDYALIARKQGEALARRLDDEIIAILDDLSHGVSATSILTMDDILDAVYTVQANTKDACASELVAVLSLKQANNIKKEIMKSGAAVFSQGSMISLLGGENKQNGYIGSGPGFRAYVVGAGLPTSGGDTIGAVFDPVECFTGMYDSAPQTVAIPVGTGNPSFGVEISSWIHHAVAEIQDDFGCYLASDT